MDLPCARIELPEASDAREALAVIEGEAEQYPPTLLEARVDLLLEARASLLLVARAGLVPARQPTWPQACAFWYEPCRVAALAYVVCALVWGTTWYAIRVCIGLGGYPSLLSAALRFTIAAAILAAELGLGFGKPHPGRRAVAWLGVCGVLNAAAYALIYRAEEEVAGGVAAALYGTMPLMTAAIVRLTGTERLRPSAIAGAVVGLVGIAVIFRDRMSVSADQALAVVLILGSVGCASTFTVLVKRHASGSSPLANTAVFFPATAAALWLLTAAVERQPVPSPLPLAPTAALLYLAVFGSVITFGAYFYLVRHVSLATVTTLVLVEPVIALLVDALFEHRVRASALTYAGAAITASGVLVAIAFGERGKAPAAKAI